MLPITFIPDANIVNVSELFVYLAKFCARHHIGKTVAKKRKSTSCGIDPEYLKKQKAALVRKNRQVIYLNDSEMAAIQRYCEKFRVTAKAVLFREAIMEKVLKELDDNHPTLF